MLKTDADEIRVPEGKDEGVGKIARIVLKLFATEGEWEEYWRKRMDLNQSVMLNLKVLEVR